MEAISEKETHYSPFASSSTNQSEPVLLSLDVFAYMHTINILEREFLPKVQFAVDGFNSWDTPPQASKANVKLQAGELHLLFNSPADLLAHKMFLIADAYPAIDESSKGATFRLHKQPSGLNALLDCIDSTLTFLQSNEYGICIPVSEVADWFAIDAGGSVFLTDNKREELKEKYRNYASTSTAKKMYAFGNAVLQAAASIGVEGELVRGEGGFETVLKSLFRRARRGAMPKVNIDTILKYNSKEYNG